MKRSPALIQLSREHHVALVWAKRAQIPQPDPDAFRAQLLDVFDCEINPHFLREETTLLPALEAQGQHQLVAQTHAEHRALREAIERIRAGDATALAPFGQALAEHVRFEERTLFETAEQLLYHRLQTESR